MAEMYQVRVTTWPHRPNIWSIQFMEFPPESEGYGRMVARGQWSEFPTETITAFLDGKGYPGIALVPSTGKEE